MPNRRHFLAGLTSTFGGLALTDLLVNEAGSALSLEPSALAHHRPKAKRVIQLFMAGAASHVDMWDYKPQLEKEQGQQWDPGELWNNSTFSPGSHCWPCSFSNCGL